VEVGYNSQLSEIDAAILRRKLGLQKRWTSTRQAIAASYLDAFAGLPLTFPNWPGAVEHVWHKFTLQCSARDQLREHLHAHHVPTLIHYARPFHREKLFGCRPDQEFPRASLHADQSLSLPIHAHLDEGEVGATIDAVRSFYR
jgi:dTDP-4-amino-4,6-dideoxygalactose transaminase